MERLAVLFDAALRRGDWLPGQRLPSSRALAERFGVSQSSANRVLRALAKRGVMESRGRLGWYVADRSPAPAHAATASFVDAFDRRARGRHVVILDVGTNEIRRYMDMPESWSGGILSGATEALNQRGLITSLIVDDVHREHGQMPLKAMRHIEEMPDAPLGVLIFSGYDNPRLLDWLDQRKLPWVIIGKPGFILGHNCVYPDLNMIGILAGMAFATLGFERLAVIENDLARWPHAAERFMGFCAGYARTAGRLPQVEIIPVIRNREPDGFQLMSDYLDHHDAPQAVFAAGDYLAIGAIRACRARGLSVPDDISIIGSTGLDIAEMVEPRLTTVSQPISQIGREAVELLCSVLHERSRRMPGRVLPVWFDFRDTMPCTDKLRDAVHASIIARYGEDHTSDADVSGHSVIHPSSVRQAEQPRSTPCNLPHPAKTT